MLETYSCGRVGHMCHKSVSIFDGGDLGFAKSCDRCQRGTQSTDIQLERPEQPPGEETLDSGRTSRCSPKRQQPVLSLRHAREHGRVRQSYDLLQILQSKPGKKGEAPQQSWSMKGSGQGLSALLYRKRSQVGPTAVQCLAQGHSYKVTEPPGDRAQVSAAPLPVSTGRPPAQGVPEVLGPSPEQTAFGARTGAQLTTSEATPEAFSVDWTSVFSSSGNLSSFQA